MHEQQVQVVSEALEAIFKRWLRYSNHETYNRFEFSRIACPTHKGELPMKIEDVYWRWCGNIRSDRRLLECLSPCQVIRQIRPSTSS